MSLPGIMALHNISHGVMSSSEGLPAVNERMGFVLTREPGNFWLPSLSFLNFEKGR